MRGEVLALIRQAFRKLGNLVPDIEYTVTTASVRDPNTATFTDTKQTFTFPALPSPYEQMEIIGNIEQGDSRFYVEAQQLSFIPVIGATINFDDEDWRVVNVKRHRAGDVVAIYELQVRK